MSQRQRIAAYGVCLDANDRLLLARAAPHLNLEGRWFLPGGGIDHGESPTEALRRELAEEAGLVIEVGDLFGVLSDVRRLPNGDSLHTLRVIYGVDSWSGELRPEKHGTTDDVRWFTRAELANLPLAFYVHEVIERFT